MKTPFYLLLAGACLLSCPIQAQDAAPAATSATTATTQPTVPTHYQNFKVATYLVRGVVRDLPTLEAQWAQINKVVHVDKVYIEVYRSTAFVQDENFLEQAKAFFKSQGVEVAGGASLDISEGAQFQTFSYTTDRDRDLTIQAMQMAARHFDEVILDDFFFNNQKSDADITAKGTKTWTQYRLDLMDYVAQNYVLKAAKDVNPNCKVVIKFPNWYEHFQANGYDLDKEPKMFDGIFTGTETRDPNITDQCLQQYESYEIFRYFENIKPGHNGGGWVDEGSTTYLDRYGEQLADTLFAKAPELMLFSWSDLNRAATVGQRPWAEQKTSFNYGDIQKYFQDNGGTVQAGFGGRGGASNDAVSWGAAAGYTARQVDGFLGKLGKPIGIASYKPYQSSGEDFLHNFFGMIGIPIELYPNYPKDAATVLLTESAKFDPDLIAKMKGSLTAGHNVVITSGLLRALQGKGLEDIIDLESTGNKIAVHSYVNAYGAGNGNAIGTNANNADILFPEIRFFTNDAWTLVRGMASGRGYPIMLMDHYSKGTLYVLAVPDNASDLYNLPPEVLAVLHNYILQGFPVQMDAPSQVSLFAYDNNTFITQSFLPTETDETITAPAGFTHLHNLVTGEVLQGQTPRGGRGGRGYVGPARSTFTVHLLPHSYAVFAAEQ